jgi:hypothetical protein
MLGRDQVGKTSVCARRVVKARIWPFEGQNFEAAALRGDSYFEMQLPQTDHPVAMGNKHIPRLARRKADRPEPELVGVT